LDGYAAEVPREGGVEVLLVAQVAGGARQQSKLKNPVITIPMSETEQPPSSEVMIGSTRMEADHAVEEGKS
jgi:hypothetical protein